MTRRPTVGRGFTMVELLVVAAIMLVLFGLVIGGTRQTSGGQVRQAAQSLASLLISAQSRALGNPVGGGIVLQSGTLAGLASTMSAVIATAEVPPLLSGTVGPQGLLGLGQPAPSRIALVLTPFNGDADELQHGYRIRFGGGAATGTRYPFQPPTPWLGFAAGPVNGAPTCSGTVSFRWSAGQAAINTVWPEPTRNSTGAPNPLDFQVSRYPVPGDSVLDVPRFAAIDLRYSGIGEDQAALWNPMSGPPPGWGSLAGKGSIAILFDGVGGVDAVMQNIEGPVSMRATQPIDPVEPLYLLVSPRAEIENPAFPPLSSPQSVWIAVHPQTGRVTTALNVPQMGIDAAALRAARAKARAGVQFGK